MREQKKLFQFLLVELVSRKRYIIELAKNHGHKVVHLSLYYYCLNLIELTYARSNRNYVTKVNKIMTSTEIENNYCRPIDSNRPGMKKIVII